MNIEKKKIPVEFGGETRFRAGPVSAAPFRAFQEDRFEGLKNRLLEEKLDRLWEARLAAPIRRAAHEAAALAWLTPYPLLLFPELFEEHALAAVARAARQEQVCHRSRELMYA